MKPWDKKFSDEELIKLWEKFIPEDFYFAIETRYNMTTVYIVPGEYFNKQCYLFDDSIPIIQYLPTYLEEIAEGIYQTKLSLSQVSIDLLSKGFKNNSHFQKFIETSGIPAFDGPNV